MIANIGFAVTYSNEVNTAIFSLVSYLQKLNDFDFALVESDSSPHISVWQGCFNDADEVIDRLDRDILVPAITPTIFNPLMVWAEKIVFLPVDPRSYFVELQRSIRLVVGDLQVAGSADPQSFRGIEAHYLASYRETGYPFAEDPFGAALPHFTLGHLCNVKASASPLVCGAWSSLSKLQSSMPTKLIAFLVEANGACRKIFWNKPLAELHLR